MANRRSRQRRPIRIKAISLAVASCFSVSAHYALGAQAVLPSGGVVTSGQVSPFVYKDNTLTITSQSNASINWQVFSIGQNGRVNFIQPSAISSVLNRVVGVDPSVILGALQSNGRVFLVNPNGILFGAGAQIDVAGLVASTLNLSNADFTAGRMRFTDTPGAGSINNQGAITTPTGGQVYLIAPDVRNSGIITSPKGEVILAAGRSVELVDAGTPNLRVEITAPDTQAVNVGQIVANSGKIGIYAGLIKNSGEIRADGVVVGQNGEILLKATQNVTLDKSSVISASGPTAGKITIQADAGTVAVAGTVDANATQGKGGTINIAAAQGITVDSGARISAAGTAGGSVTLTAAGPVTANITAARANEIVLTAPSVPLTTGSQLNAGGTQASGTLTVSGGAVTTPHVGNTVALTSGAGDIAVQGTIDVSGSAAQGGSVSISARDDITLDITSRILARGAAGGEVRVEATKGTLLASGLIDGQGTNGPGGKVYLLAPRVALLRRAVVDVSGAVGGGVALIGGDFQGNNLLVQNASRTYFGPDAIIRADAVTSGDGGKVIVWSDDGTQAYGTISARGGALSGKGGFVETSGKAWLDFAATVDTSAPHGAFGTLLLDPKNIDVNNAGGAAYGGNNLFADNIGGNSVIRATGAGSISAQVADVLLQADNDITFTSAVNIANAGTKLTAQAGRSILVNANITTNNGDVTLIANDPTSTANRDPGAGGITMAAGTTINAGTGMVLLDVMPGGTSGAITIDNITAFNVNVQQDGYDFGSSILRASGASLITARNLLLEVDHSGNPGNGSVGTSAQPIRIAPFGGTTINFESHEHETSAGIFIDAPVAGTNLVIGDVPFFFGGVRGVQTVNGGAIEINVSGAGGTLTTNPGTANCTFGVGTGGPICANSNNSSNGIATVNLTADGDIFINNIVRATGNLSYFNSNVTLASPVAAVNITSNKGAVTLTSATVQAIGSVQADGAEGTTINVNAPIATVNIQGNTGVVVQTGSTINVAGNLAVNGYFGSSNNAIVNLNKSIAEANITATGAGPGAANGVIITGSTINVTGQFLASGDSYNNYVALTIAGGAPVAALNVAGTGVNGVTVSGSTINVNGSVTASASSGAGNTSIQGTFNDALAAVNITGTGTGAALSGVTLGAGTAINVNGAVNANAYGSEGFGNAYVDFITAANAPVAALSITGNGGTTTGVAITGTTINVQGVANAYASSGSARVSGTLNAPLASAKIAGANGVSISGSSITVDGTLSSSSSFGFASNSVVMNGPAAVASITSSTANISIDNSTVSADGAEGNAGGALLTIAATGASGNVVIQNGSLLEANGKLAGSGGSTLDIDTPVAAVDIKSTNGTVTVDSSTVSATGDLQGDGDGVYTVNLNAALAAVSITGGNGVIINGSAIDATATASVDFTDYGTFTLNANDSLARVYINNGLTPGTGPDSGVTITGTTITVAATVSANAHSNSATVNLNTCGPCGAPLADLNINGSGVKGVTVDSSTLTVTGQANGYASSFGYLNVGGIIDAPLAQAVITGSTAAATSGVTISGGTMINVSAQMNAHASNSAMVDPTVYINNTLNAALAQMIIGGTGTGAATGGVTVTGSTINVFGQMNAFAASSGSVNVNSTVNAPLAQMVISGSSGATTNGVTITGSHINVNGSMNAGSSGGSAVNGRVNFNSAVNAPLAYLDISSGNGVSITGTDITVSGALNAYVGFGSASFNGSINAPLAQIDISGNGGAVNGVTLDTSPVTANATLSNADGGEGFSIQQEAAVVNITSTAGNINIPGSLITANADDGGFGIITSHVLLQTTNGNILGDALSLLTASAPGCMGCGLNSIVELRATKGIGQLGNPIIFADDKLDIIAVNTGTGDLSIAQFTGDVDINNFGNIVNTTPGGTIELTALGGNFTVRDTVSNPFGRLTVRSAFAGGILTVDGGSGGMLTTGSGAGNDITLIADDMDIRGPVLSGSGFINVRTYTPGVATWLGSSGLGGGQLELSMSELDFMTNLAGTGGGLVIGDTAKGPVIFKGPVGPTTSFLNVFGTSITQDPGADITTALNAGASGDIILTNPGNNFGYDGIAPGSFSTGNLVGGNVFLVTSSDISLNSISALGDVGVTSAGALTATANISAGTSNAITLASTGVLNVNDGVTISGGTLDIQSTSGFVQLENASLQALQTGLGNSTVAINVASNGAGGLVSSSANMSTVSGAIAISATRFVGLDALSDGAIIHAAGDVNITALTESIDAYGPNPATAWMEVWGTNVNLNAGTFVNLGAVSGHGLRATTGDVTVTAVGSFGGYAPGAMRGPIVADNGNVVIKLTGNVMFPHDSFMDLGDAISAPNGTITIDNGGGGAILGSINLKSASASSDITLKAADFIFVGSGGASSTGGTVDINSGDVLFSTGAISAPIINLTSTNGMSVLVASSGAGLTATNSTSSDIFLTSTAPLFTVGGGGAAISNAAAGGRYFITAVNNMALNPGVANDQQAQFGAGNLLTVNGYSNLTGLGVVMAGGNVTFNGATTVSGALGVFGGSVNVNTLVQGGSVNVVTSVLNVNGGDFQSTAGNFVGTVSGDVNVSGGGRIYGNPDIKLTVGGSVFINGANSTVEAFSPNSIHLLFPTRTDGGFTVNGTDGRVWDGGTSTGFFIGQTGLPAVLGQNLLVEYGITGLPSDVFSAINAAIDATNKSGQPQNDKDKDKDTDSDKEKSGSDDKSLGSNLKLQCS